MAFHNFQKKNSNWKQPFQKKIKPKTASFQKKCFQTANSYFHKNSNRKQLFLKISCYFQTESCYFETERNPIAALERKNLFCKCHIVAFINWHMDQREEVVLWYGLCTKLNRFSLRCCASKMIALRLYLELNNICLYVYLFEQNKPELYS